MRKYVKILVSITGSTPLFSAMFGNLYPMHPLESARLEDCHYKAHLNKLCFADFILYRPTSAGYSALMHVRVFFLMLVHNGSCSQQYCASIDSLDRQKYRF